MERPSILLSKTGIFRNEQPDLRLPSADGQPLHKAPVRRVAAVILGEGRAAAAASPGNLCNQIVPAGRVVFYRRIDPIRDGTKFPRRLNLGTIYGARRRRRNSRSAHSLEQRVDLEDAIMLFRRLGVDVHSLSGTEFKLSYRRLAKRYHPDLNRVPRADGAH
jgi:hypothetical protein